MLPLLGWTAYKALLGASTDVLEWLPGDSGEVSSLVWFDRHFGSDQVLVVSWEGAALGDPLVTEAEKALAGMRSSSGERLFSRVVSGSGVMRYLAGPMRVDRDVVLERLDGWLSGPGEATAIVAVISKAGALERAESLQRVRSMVVENTGLNAAQIRMAGTTMDGEAVNVASQSNILLLTAVAVIVAILVAVFVLRGMLNALPVLVSALTGMLGSLAGMYWLGITVDGLSIIVPVLGFVLTASATLHLDGYRRRGSSETNAMYVALKRGAWPTSIALLTTCVGFASLAFSGTLPVQRFAIAASLTVIIAALVTALVWPALVIAMRASRLSSSGGFSGHPLGVVLMANHRKVFAIFGILVLASLIGLPRLDSAFGIDRILRADNPLIADYHWFEENLGNVIPVEVVVRIKADTRNPQQAFLQRIELLGNARNALLSIPGVGGVFSAETFMPSDAMLFAGDNEELLQGRINGLKRRANGFALLSFEENGDELWRISARVSAFGGLDFNQLDRTLGKTVRETFHGYPDVLDVRVLGGLPMVAKAQQQLLRDLLVSFGLALTILSVVFALIFRSIRTGILMLVPNVLPVTLVFGLLGWFRSPIDIGLVMTASVALGLAVDDSSHILIAYRRALRKGGARKDAVQLALHQIAPAAVRTSLLCGVPMLVFSQSEFLPSARFGTVIAALIATALIVDLVLLPTLLEKFGLKK